MLNRIGQPNMAIRKLNPHNQYFQTAIEVGMVGLFFLLAIIFFGLYYAILNKNWLLLFILISLAFNCLFESILQRQSGIVFYTFWISLLFSRGSGRLNPKSLLEDVGTRLVSQISQSIWKLWNLQSHDRISLFGYLKSWVELQALHKIGIRWSVEHHLFCTFRWVLVLNVWFGSFHQQIHHRSMNNRRHYLSLEVKMNKYEIKCLKYLP